MSKFEQCSAWEVRPLREAQLHYAAMDAYVLLELFNKMEELYKFDRKSMIFSGIIFAN